MRKFSLVRELLLRLAMFWFVVSPLVVLWDVGFILMRPRSLPGGDLHLFWKPYALYITIDKPYGDMEDPFVIGQALLNIVEVILCFTTAALLSQFKSSAALVGFLVSTMTFWKTVLYMIQYTWLCNGAHRLAHLNWMEFILLFLLPNGIWLFFPLLFMGYFGFIIMNALDPPKTKNS